MADEALIAQVIALPGVSEQERFLAARLDLVDEPLGLALKKQADRFLRSDVHRSLDTAAMMVRLGERAGQPLCRALGLLAEANVRSVGGLGEHERAIALYDEAAGIYCTHNRPIEQARSQTGKLYALANLGRYDDAIAAGRWAGAVLEQHEQWLPLATLTLNIGLIYGRLGDDSQALALFDRANELYLRVGAEGEPSLPWVAHDRAIVLRNLGRFAESMAAGQSACERLASSGQTVEAARARQNMALTLVVLGRYNEALDLLDEARRVFAADGRARDVILVDLFVADCLLQARRYGDVLEQCGRLRASFADLGAHLEAGQAMVSEAVAYAGLGRHDEAMASLAEARALFGREGNPVWLAYTDLETAALLLRQGQAERSLALALACADVLAQHNAPVRTAQAQLAAARAAAALGRDGQARDLAQAALRAAAGAELPTIAYQGRLVLGGLAAAGGDRGAAMAHYEAAIDQMERLRGRLMIEYRSDFLEDKQGVYQDMVRLCLEDGQPQRALEYAERATSRALLEMLAYRLDLSLQVRQPADAPLVAELQGLRAERDRLYRRWQGREEAAAEDWTAAEQSRRQVRQETLQIEKKLTERWHSLLVHNAAYARDAALWQVRSEPVQPFLPADTALVEYYRAGRAYVAFVVTAQSVQAIPLVVDAAAVQRTIDALWLNLQAAPTSGARQRAGLAANARGLLQRLHAMLMAPLAAALEPFAKLIVVPHGPLHYVPMHALHDGDRYLVQRCEVSYLPGSSVLRYCREARPAAARRVALGYSGSGRLPYAAEETQTVARLLGGDVYVEDTATLARLRDVAGECQVLHLAAHGEFRADNPLFSGLALADGWLTTLDIFSLRLKASLVTLSGCQTGRSVIGGGNELLGLMRAVLYAGAASALLSLWSVDDRSTARLMEGFYSRLACGQSKGEALRAAQLEALQSRPGADHPYAWAGFCLVGDSGAL